MHCLQYNRPGFNPLGQEDPLGKGMATHSRFLVLQYSGNVKGGCMRERDECSPSNTWTYSQLSFEESQISCFFLFFWFMHVLSFCLILDLEATTGVGNTRRVDVCGRENRDNCAFGENEKRHEDLTNKLPHREAKGVKSIRKLRKKAENLKSRVPIGDKPKSNEIANRNKEDIILSF